MRKILFLFALIGMISCGMNEIGPNDDQLPNQGNPFRIFNTDVLNDSISTRASNDSSCTEEVVYQGDLKTANNLTMPYVITSSGWNIPDSLQQPEKGGTRGTLISSAASITSFGISSAVYDNANEYNSSGCGSYFFNLQAEPGVPISYYWPADGKLLSFYAHYPYGITVSSSASSLGYPLYSYTVPSSIATQLDIMTASKHNQTDNGLPVGLSFTHHCAALNFTIKNNRTEPLEIRSISILGVKYSGTLQNGSWSLSSAVNSSSVNPFTLTKTVTLAAGETQNYTGSSPFIMLPQSIPDGAKIKMTTEDEEFEDNLSGTWVAGKIYTYNIGVKPLKTDPTYTAPTARELTYTGSAQTLLNAGSTSDGTMQYSSDNSSWSPTIPTGINAGNYTVYWKIVGDATHFDKDPESIAVTIAKAAPTYTAPTAKSLSYTGSAQTLLNAGSTSHGTIQYSSDNSSWSTTIPTGTAAGSYDVYWRLVGDANHNDIASTKLTASIGKTQATGTAPTAKSLTYTGSAQALVNAGSTSQGTMKYSLDNSTWSTTIPTGTNAGNYMVYWMITGDANHTDKPSASVAVTIAKAAPTYTAPTAKSLSYTGSAQALVNAGSTSQGTMKYSLDNSTWSTTIPTGTNAGNYMVYWMITGDANHTDKPSASVAVTIAKAAPTYTAPTAKSLTYTGSAQALLNAGSTSHGTIQYSSNNSSWSTTIPTGTNAGSYTVYWRLVGGANHNDVSSKSISVTIAKKASAISFSGSTAEVIVGNTLTKTATRSAGDGAITYSSSNTGIATVNNSGVVTGVAAGTCTITVTTGETTNFNAATATYTLTVRGSTDPNSVTINDWTAQ